MLGRHHFRRSGGSGLRLGLKRGFTCFGGRVLSLARGLIRHNAQSIFGNIGLPRISGLAAEKSSFLRKIPKKQVFFADINPTTAG
jgi:hypothetical protein